MIKFVLSNLTLISIATASTLKVPSQYSSIQAAIDASTDGDTVSVAAGTYVENISYSGKSISIIGEDRETTIIDGDSSGIVVSFISGEDSSAVLRGFTITNGFNSVGAGIYVESSSPTLTDLIISRNTTGKEGGQPSGGGICLRYSSSSIDNVIFEDNYAYYQGGGIETRHSDILLTNSIFRGNYGGANSGAGWFGFSSDVTIENVLATDNEAHYGYGAFGIYSNTDLYLINATLTDNESSSGDALGVSSTSNATVSNCIFYNNRDHNGEITGPIRLAGTNSSLDIQYSDVQGGQDAIIMNDQSTVNWGAGNIDADPLFVDPDSGDYHLSDLSPAISGGIDSWKIDNIWYVAPSTDLDGNPRPNPVGSIPDLGAYENPLGEFSDKPTDPTQVSFSAHEIPTDHICCYYVYPVDIDGDGDMDVISGSQASKEITLYENDGLENFKAYTIATNIDGIFEVHAVDVDGDGDIDVISAGFNDDTIAWHENDGSQNFTTHAITTSADKATSVHAADIDGDGDMDILSASRADDTVAWYKNDGSQNFTTHAITTSADGARYVYASDIDSDGDMDVLSASIFDEEINWYENDGSGQFTEHSIVNYDEDVDPVSIYATDIDNDGDMDVLAALLLIDTIYWYENDGFENFTTNTITTSSDWVRSVHAADMDNDGDMDVLSASRDDSTFAWYENDGFENFTTRIISRTSVFASTVYATDINSDGYMDVLAGSRGDTKIIWYENLLNYPPESFDLVYPYNDATIILTRDNFLDTLFFAWDQSLDPEGYEVIYRRELSGDLPNYIKFIVESEKDNTANMYKVPYHHIEHYMHEAGVEQITGTWTIIATDGKLDTYADNGPFTLTIDGSKLGIESGEMVPEIFALHANYPNPFNPNTTISYDLPEQAQVTLNIYDLLGKQIITLVNQAQNAGNKIAMWDGTDNLGRQVSAGVYLYRIQAGEFRQTRKMLLLK